MRLFAADGKVFTATFVLGFVLCCGIRSACRSNQRACARREFDGKGDDA